MIIATIILALLIGVSLLLMEVVVIPGFGICGIGGGLLTLFAYYITFSRYGTSWGIAAIAISIALFAILWYLLVNSRFSKVMHLNTTIDSHVSDDYGNNQITPGTHAIALTRMNLVGRIKIDDKEYEGRCITFVEAGTQLEVVGTEDNVVVVKATQSDCIDK
ncbi:MAG: NfeD family protein [Bacteroidales bacterium]|nr:NfeD family protein [Bacteroidales bacterium]